MRRSTALVAMWDRQRVSGKNLADPTKFENGTIQSSSGNTQNGTNRIRSIALYLTAGNYNLSIVGYKDARLGGVHTYRGENQEWAGSVSNSNKTSASFTLNEALYVRYVIYTNASGVNLTIDDAPYLDIQLERGTAKTEYEPYCGGTPYYFTVDNCKGGYFSVTDDFGLKVVGNTAQDGTPTPETPMPIQCVKAGTKVRCVGKNLFPYTEIADKTQSNITFTPTDDGVLINGTATASPTFGASINKKYLEIGATYVCRDFGSKHLTTFLQVKQANGTVVYKGAYTIVGDEQSIWCFTQVTKGSTCDNYLCQPQVEKANTHTNFERYYSTEVNIPCDLYEGDIYFPMTGKVVRYTKSIMLDGSEIVMEKETYFGAMQTVFVPEGTPDDSKTPFCPYFWGISRNDLNANLGTDRSNRLLVRETMIGIGYDGTAAELKAFIAANPMTVLYRSTVPSIEQYEPQPISAPRGTVNVLQAPTELNADLSATMLVRR